MEPPHADPAGELEALVSQLSLDAGGAAAGVGDGDRRRALRLSSLYRWLRANGFDPAATALRLARHATSGVGFGLVAARPILKGELLAAAPLSLALLPLPAAAEGAPPPPPPGGASGELERMLARLLAEDAAPDSFWRPLLDVLPRTFATPEFFEDEDVELLECPRAKAAARKKRDACRAAYERLKPWLQERLPPSHQSLDAFKWAWAAVRSRHFVLAPPPAPEAAPEAAPKAQAAPPAAEPAPDAPQPPSEPTAGMFPFIDMLNHEPRSPNAFGLSPASSAMEIRAGRDYREGEEVTIQYRAMDSWRLLKGYGFVPPDNPHDRVRFTAEEALLETLRREWPAAEAERRAALLREKGLLKGLYVGADGRASPPLVRAAGVVFLARQAGEDERLWASRLRLVAEGKLGVRPEVHRRASAHVGHLLRSALRRFTSSAEDSERLLAAADGRATARLAVQWRLAQQRLLAELTRPRAAAAVAASTPPTLAGCGAEARSGQPPPQDERCSQ